MSFGVLKTLPYLLSNCSKFQYLKWADDDSQWVRIFFVYLFMSRSIACTSNEYINKVYSDSRRKVFIYLWGHSAIISFSFVSSQVAIFPDIPRPAVLSRPLAQHWIISSERCLFANTICEHLPYKIHSLWIPATDCRFTYNIVILVTLNLNYEFRLVIMLNFIRLTQKA